MVVAGPGDDECAVRPLAVRKADPALLGHVELAAQPPIVALQEVGAGVFGRNGNHRFWILDFGFWIWVLHLPVFRHSAFCLLPSAFFLVFLALQRPHPLPLRPFAQAARLVTEYGE